MADNDNLIKIQEMQMDLLKNLISHVDSITHVAGANNLVLICLIESNLNPEKFKTSFNEMMNHVRTRDTAGSRNILPQLAIYEEIINKDVEDGHSSVSG